MSELAIPLFELGTLYDAGMSGGTTILSVINRKGGVGKSTTTIHLGAALAASGASTLLMDCDLNHGLTSHFDVTPGQDTIADVLRAKVPLAATVQQLRPNLFLCPATEDIERAEAELMGAPGAEVRLKRAMKAFLATGVELDFVLIDCPGGWGNITRNALLASDAMIVPINSSAFSSNVAAATIGSAEELRHFYDHNLRLLGVLLTVWHDTNATRAVAQDCEETWGPAMFETRIRRTTIINEMELRRESLSDDDADSGVRDDYAALAKEVRQRTGHVK